MTLTEKLKTIERDGRQLLLPIWRDGEKVFLIDQTKLPFSSPVYEMTTVEMLGKAVKDMVIRGSGALGLAGAYGMFLAVKQHGSDQKALLQAANYLKSTRPTAVNMMKTIDEMLTRVFKADDFLASAHAVSEEIVDRQLSFEMQLGNHGAALIEDGDTIMTHCHSGAVAGAGYGGRALSVIRAAHESGKEIEVIVNETRPYLQGARITAWELQQLNIPFRLITDNMSGYCMSAGLINKVVVGSDRVAANGDLANKIGTYLHALAAQDNGIPFYTATSSHTIDFDIKRGGNIEVEMRASNEVTSFGGIQTAPEGTEALYPGFDITPNHLISGIITEKGVVTPEYTENLAKLFKEDESNV
ncbi:S-methyl-5-thioribose-1-phosphate isomerase [Aquibacillus albus]|uniref:Methylthioribose-1-phosphate isomerase n=1 Tax=Aquibacillus albus TaxID=1168171 RepID=A0ABS2MXZ4_9BACI|nr:S-methyl-5-thioribose-1-phosphate isomerase [Aquibacillus albus]MBM7570719.1 methylthioribose-1-phosphate isomerase [Aquibacillus albus]